LPFADETTLSAPRIAAMSPQRQFGIVGIVSSHPSSTVGLWQ